MNNLDDFVKVDEEYEDIDTNKLVICRWFFVAHQVFDEMCSFFHM